MVFFRCLLSLLLAAASPSETEKIMPVHNLTLQWTSDFDAQLWWAHKHLPSNCMYKVLWRTKEEYSTEESNHQTPPSLLSFSMEGGSLFISVHTVCKDQHSQPAVLNVTYPELVSDVQCSIISSMLTQCSWRPLGPPPSLSFYYGLVDELEDTASSELQECPLYTHTEGLRTGCHLQSTAIQSIYMLFNTTLNETLVRNTFKVMPVPVTPRPLNWSVSEVAGKFILNWIPPDVLRLSRWTFIINYTECDERKIIEVPGKTSALIHRVSHCCYRMSLKARSLHGETGWSDAKYFDEAKDANAMLYAAVIIPLLFAGLTSLTCVWFRRKKEHIFTKVPQPRDLLSDIYNHQTKSAVFNLHFPEKEEEDPKITLVTDLQQSQSHHYI
uniref:uncharacterized protein LOC131125515 n=1 Tax=Doryrhamphus excisus TaxID=161450 RepID=UPI0025AE8B5A|nr:uncharacterized protein LOC131125515 [Doryrhamphus excisus]